MREAVIALAERFWHDAAAAGVQLAVPRPIDEAAEATLPLSIVRLDDLTPRAASQWLGRRGIANDLPQDDRPFHGCLSAVRGHGFIFVRAADTLEQRRLTVAHEVAHFMLHVLAPRRQLLSAFGESAASVLDGDAPAPADQRIAAAMVGLRLGPHVHLLDAAGEAADEGEADDLAIELLAPTSLLKAQADAEPAEVAAWWGVPVEAVRPQLARLRPRRLDPLVAWMSRQLLEARP